MEENKNENSKFNPSTMSQSTLIKLVDKTVEPFGRYQIFVFIILSINSLIIAVNHTLTTFHVYTPTNFTCVQTDNEEAYENFTCVAGCTSYDFMGTDTSIVTEWNLICDRRYLSALVNTFYFIGVTIGSFICGALADIYGRQKLILGCLYFQGIFGATLYYASTLQTFMILRFIQGFFVQGLQGASYILMQEITPARHLTFTGLSWEVFWACGLIFLGTTSYFVRDWRLLQLYLVIPTILTIAWCWLIPESPKWFLAKNKRDKTFKSIRMIAGRNNDEEVLKEFNMLQLKDSKKEITEEPHHQTTMFDLFRNKILLKHLFVMISVWYSVTLSYYGILLYLPKLPGGRHLNFLIGAFLEVIAYVSAYFILSSKLGRRHSMIMYQYLNGVFCITLGVLTFIPNETAWKSLTIVVIALVGKGLAVSCFGGMFIYGAELFPTVTRASAIGLCGFFSRVGSLTAPQIILLGEMTHPMVPMAVMASFLFLSGTLTFTVPETSNKKLPNTLDDVDETWGTSTRL